MRWHWRRARGCFSLHAPGGFGGSCPPQDPTDRAAGLPDASVARFHAGALTQEGLVEMLVDHIYPSDIAELVGSCASVPSARAAASSAPHRDVGLSPRRPIDAEARANRTGLCSAAWLRTVQPPKATAAAAAAASAAKRPSMRFI
jgi:hypothetical protein